MHHDQVKTRHTIWLTPNTWDKAKTLAKNQKTSVSELIEELIRNIDGE